jgi:hypothetical protein
MVRRVHTEKDGNKFLLMDDLRVIHASLFSAAGNEKIETVLQKKTAGTSPAV